MTSDDRSSQHSSWLEACGLRHIVRIFSIAVHPSKLWIGLVATIMTFAWGGLLDWVGTQRGGVDPAVVANYVFSHEMDRPYVESPGDSGIFEAWCAHERRSISGFLGSLIPGGAVVGGASSNFGQTSSFAQALRYCKHMYYGELWFLKYHTGFYIVFCLGMLAIWSWCGGAICRIACVEFARGDKLTASEGWAYAREKFFSGFFLSQCIPGICIAVVLVLMALGGAFLRIPWLGDLFGGLAFFLAIIGGFIVSVLLVGWSVGGSLFWPAVAAEGSDAFDAFSRAFSFVFAKPLKLVLYWLIATVYLAICWLLVNLFAFLTLTITRTVVGFGTSPFGWWSRGSEGDAVSKLDVLWPAPTPAVLHSWPQWDQLGRFEYISAFLIGIYVLIFIGLTWSFLVSFYFSGSTVIYHLLRRDVDGVELDELYVEDSSGDADKAPALAGERN